MRLKHRAGTCDNGPCPNVFDTDQNKLAAVQGTRHADSTGISVLIPPALLQEYAQAVGGEVETGRPGLRGPAVVEPTADGLVAVRGTELTDAEARAQLSLMPAHETVVLVSKDALLEYALANAPKEGS